MTCVGILLRDWRNAGEQQEAAGVVEARQQAEDNCTPAAAPERGVVEAAAAAEAL